MSSSSLALLEARFSASWPCSSRWPSSVLGTRTPSMKTALPMPVPKVSTITVPLTVAAGAEVHLGDAGRVRVVDHRHRQAAQPLAEQRARVGVDPALVDVRRRTDRGSVGDHAGEGDPDRPGPAEVVDDLLDAVGHPVGRGRVRGEHLVALLRQVALVQVHRGALDPGSADVHAEDLHGPTLRRRTDGHGRDDGPRPGSPITPRPLLDHSPDSSPVPAPAPPRSAASVAASSRRSRRSSLGRENVMDSSAALTISTSS